MTLDERAVRHASQPGLEVRAGVADNLVLAGHDGGEIDADRSDVHAKICPAPREVGGIGACDQRLGRRAAGVDAGSADQLAFDKRNLLPGRRKPADHRRTGLTGADDDGVETAVHRSAGRFAKSAKREEPLIVLPSGCAHTSFHNWTVGSFLSCS